MKTDRFDAMERFAPLFEAPEPSFEGFIRRRDRKRRNQRVTAIVVAIAIFVVPALVVAWDAWSERAPSPAEPGRSESPGAFVIDRAFVDSINGCERPLVTLQDVQSALGFRSAEPIPNELGGTPGRSGVPHPLSTGCRYGSEPGTDGWGGRLLITAYLASAPPRPLGRGSFIRGLGDEARFTRFGNGVDHLVDSGEGATSLLEVRSGDIILRFNGGTYETVDGVVASGPIGYELSRLRQLAERALATLDG